MSDSVTISCTLSKFSDELDCYVLNPEALPTIINAFHPDYMKTYHPDFMKDFRTTEANQNERRVNEPRKVIRPPRASVKVPKKKHINNKSEQSMTMAQIKEEMLKRTNFYTYSKAGAPK